MKTRTAKGVEVELLPSSGRVLCRFEHPKAGRVSFVADGWATKNGEEGVCGYGYSPTLKKQIGVCLVIPKADWEVALVEAKEDLARAEAERQEKQAARRTAALAECPADHEICRQKWANGDLCSAEYEAEDGTKVLASDLLECHHGWYYLPRAELDEVRVKSALKIAAGKSADAKVEADRAEIFARARETGKPVVIRSWTEDCNAPREECSTDVITEWANPDGTTKTTRQHAW